MKIIFKYESKKSELIDPDEKETLNFGEIVLYSFCITVMKEFHSHPIGKEKVER